MKTKLIGSAPTIEQLSKLIVEYFCGTRIQLVDTSKGYLEVHNSSGLIQGVRVVSKRGRFRFEMELA